MEEILEKLYKSLSDTFEQNLKAKEVYVFETNESVDVFKTLMFLKKNNNDLNNLMLQGAISIDELQYSYSKEIIKECLDNKYILRGNSINSDKVFLGANGMFKLYSLKQFNINDVFIAFDVNKFVFEKEFTLKSQEKIWCIFLLLFGADSKENLFNSEGLAHEKLKNYHEFFVSIENEMNVNGVSLGNKIGWDTGKDLSFRKFITNIVNLSKTPVYFKEGYRYYLDLSKRKNAIYLLDLILDKYSGEKRLMANELFYNALKELSFNMNIDLGEMPRDINKFIIEELKG